MKHDKTKMVQHTISIKRRIDTDKALKNFIFKNSNYRRKVWNDFVEEYYRCKERNENFNPIAYSTNYYNEVEKYDPEYRKYCTGIREQVSKDIRASLKLCKLESGELHYKKYNKYKSSFKLHCHSYYRTLTTSDIPHFLSSVYINDKDTISFRPGNQKGYRFNIHLKESLWTNLVPLVDPTDNRYKPFFYVQNCWFREEDIKCISFIHELGKFYVVLEITAFYIVSDNKDKIKKAGIDLGIHNPICLYDGECYVNRLSDKELKRIHYLERRAKRLQHIMDKKEYGSKNYEKVRKKFRITWKKIFNIRLNLRRKTAKQIATRYRKICVDSFRTPDNSNNCYPKVVTREWNYLNRMHGTYLFNESLKHACIKYGCKYIEAPNNTTCACNKCGYINPHIPLTQRIFTCNNCGYSVDRDENAAKNCYAYA